MKEIQQFRFNPSDSIIRVEMVDGEPMFVAMDVCDALGITKHRDAVSRLDSDERGSVVVDTPGGKQSVSAVNESGLYSLIFQSRKPEAKSFRKWVTSEVLPSIRKTGRYEVMQPQARTTRRMKRAEIVNMEMMELLWLIREFLIEGDIKRTALEIGVSQQTAHRVLNGESRNARVLKAYYDVARKNRSDGMLEFYSNPKKMRQRFMGISDGGEDKAMRTFKKGDVPEGYEKRQVEPEGYKRPHGNIGNQNARKYKK